jgi:GNAT superfamily N-acetyltransferase
VSRLEGSPPVQVTYSFDVPRPEEFKALYDGTGWGENSLDVFERALHGSWLVASARQRDTLIGMGRVISDGVLHAFVTEMIVHESMRGLGVGAELLRRIVERTVERGITDIQLFAAAGRQRFYERNGFVARPGNAPGMQLVQLPRARRAVTARPGRVHR